MNDLKFEKGLELVLDSMKEAGHFSSEEMSAFKESHPKVESIVHKVVDAWSDGLNWNDLLVLGELVPDLMRFVSDFPASGPAKRKVVKDTIWAVYRALDTCPDGNQNNIDLPVVFGALERKVEEMIVGFAVDMVIGSHFDKMREKGEV